MNPSNINCAESNQEKENIPVYESDLKEEELLARADKLYSLNSSFSEDTVVDVNHRVENRIVINFFSEEESGTDSLLDITVNSHELIHVYERNFNFFQDIFEEVDEDAKTKANLHLSSIDVDN